MTRLLLLPGMDGTGDLFAPLVAETSWATTQIVRYPTQECLSVDELVDRIEITEPVTVVGESFGGLVGLRLAARRPALVQQLVLAGAFVTPPRGSGLLRLFGSLPFLRPPPRWSTRAFLTGRDASPALVTQIQDTLRQVAPRVLAHRLAAISRVDERATLRALDLPIVTIAARHDRLVSARNLAELRSEVRSGRHFDLDAPHLMLQVRPREAAQILATEVRLNLKGADGVRVSAPQFTRDEVAP